MEFVGLLFGKEFMVLLCIYYCYMRRRRRRWFADYCDDDGNGSKFKGGCFPRFGVWKNSLRVSLLLTDDYTKDLRTNMGQYGTGQSKLHGKLGYLIPLELLMGFKSQSFRPK